MVDRLGSELFRQCDSCCVVIWIVRGGSSALNAPLSVCLSFAHSSGVTALDGCIISSLRIHVTSHLHFIVSKKWTSHFLRCVPVHENISHSFSESHLCTESTCQELIEGMALGCENEGSCIGCCCGTVPLSTARLP